MTEGFVEVAPCVIKASDRGLELVSIGSYWFEIDKNDPDFHCEEVELWGVDKRFKVRLYRPKKRLQVGQWSIGPNQWFIALGDVEEAGELEHYF